MTWLELWIQTPLAKSLAATLLHSLWEGAAIAILLAASLCALRSPRARYAAACLAIAATFASFVFTLARLWPAGAALAARHVGPLAGAPPIDFALADAFQPYAFRAADMLPWLAPFWIVGVFAFHLRSLAGWFAARRLRRSGVCCVAAQWSARLDGLTSRLRLLRPVKLFESSLADAPLVIGFLRPVILMPAGLLAGLPPAQIEAILAHELAHIRRQDYLVNLMQTFVEGLLFYHPAVWWISHVIRAERENCCDDVAVAVSGDARQYAAALTALEHNRFAARELALAASGGSLVNRIRRILERPERPRVGFAPLASVAVLTLATAAVLAAWQTSPAATAQHPAALSASPLAAAAPATTAAAPARLTDRWGWAVTNFAWWIGTGHAPASPTLSKNAIDAPSRQAETGHVLENPHQSLDEMRTRRPAKPSAITEIAAAQDRPSGLQTAPAPPASQQQTASTPYTRWVTQDVAYIITDQERATYNSLENDAEREAFIQQFWEKRDPTPGTPENEFKDEHYRRIAYVNEHFASLVPGWKTDRGRIYIVYGPPDEIEDHSQGGAYRRPPEEGGGQITAVPFQQWRYRHIDGIGSNVIIEFIDPANTNEWRMTSDPSEKDAQRYSAAAAGNSYISVGGDPMVTVNAAPGGIVTVNVDENAQLGSWAFAFEILSGGKPVNSAHNTLRLAKPPVTGRVNYRNGFHLAPGAYTVNVTVKDPTGVTQTKSVNFYVN